ncbi:hypothetical protein HPP92_002349 [Vanilla planifolia]|uniref:Uncharacterized protein n=1 Tax=Vanilla planifolia TaxID=51239 RepID=A0A835SEJ6_VANPL|nr:hypothetical protein HPP92_002349 [Vanilla planifolia]
MVIFCCFRISLGFLLLLQCTLIDMVLLSCIPLFCAFNLFFNVFYLNYNIIISLKLVSCGDGNHFRYAPATQLWRGRLHVMGGSKENRHTPGLEHWSLAVFFSLPNQLPFCLQLSAFLFLLKSCVVVHDKLFVIGGQEGDFMPKPGSPIFKCSRRHEKWYVIGRMPYRMKTTLAGFWNGWLYFTSRQRDRGPDDPSPRKVVGSMWRTKLKLQSS